MSRLTEPGRRLNFTLDNSHNHLPHLFAMTDEVRGPDPLALIERLPSHAGLVFRHYQHPGRGKLARDVVDQCKQRGIFCLIGGDIGLAIALDADGVHMPEALLQKSYRDLRAFQNRGGWVTAAAHSLAAAHKAERARVDGVFLSPVFATKSHPGGRVLGISRFARITRQLNTPVFALGGINSGTKAQASNAGAYGIAGIGLFD